MYGHCYKKKWNKKENEADRREKGDDNDVKKKIVWKNVNAASHKMKMNMFFFLDIPDVRLRYP